VPSPEDAAALAAKTAIADSIMVELGALRKTTFLMEGQDGEMFGCDEVEEKVSWALLRVD
jgi:hypothetical protein